MVNAASAAPGMLDNCDVPDVPYSERMKEWFAICQDHPFLAFICGYPMSEPIPPRPLSSPELAALVGTLRDETHRRILLDLLLDLLTPALIELVKTLKERGEI